jgi:hypothetical protein
MAGHRAGRSSEESSSTNGFSRAFRSTALDETLSMSLETIQAKTAMSLIRRSAIQGRIFVAPIVLA